MAGVVEAANGAFDLDATVSPCAICMSPRGDLVVASCGNRRHGACRSCLKMALTQPARRHPIGRGDGAMGCVAAGCGGSFDLRSLLGALDDAKDKGHVLKIVADLRKKETAPAPAAAKTSAAQLGSKRKQFLAACGFLRKPDIAKKPAQAVDEYLSRNGVPSDVLAAARACVAAGDDPAATMAFVEAPGHPHVDAPPEVVDGVPDHVGHVSVRLVRGPAHLVRRVPRGRVRGGRDFGREVVALPQRVGAAVEPRTRGVARRRRKVLEDGVRLALRGPVRRRRRRLGRVVVVLEVAHDLGRLVERVREARRPAGPRPRDLAAQRRGVRCRVVVLEARDDLDAAADDRGGLEVVNFELARRRLDDHALLDGGPRRAGVVEEAQRAVLAAAEHGAVLRAESVGVVVVDVERGVAGRAGAHAAADDVPLPELLQALQRETFVAGPACFRGSAWERAARAFGRFFCVNLECSLKVNSGVFLKGSSMAEIEGLVRALREGDDAAKIAAAQELCTHAQYLVYYPHARVLIAEAGGIAPLVDLQRHGWVTAGEVLLDIAHNNDVNAVAIAMTVGFDALVELARRGSVTVNNASVVSNAALPAKRKAALVVAALLGDSVPDSAPHDIKAVIKSYL